MMFALALLFVLAAVGRCHTVITYPGWRGNNLGLNGSVDDTNGLGVGLSDSELVYPFGMQWIYPCGGLPISSNRTRWPVGGGAVAFQPGWYTGHEHALIYINIGFGDVPQNYSVPLARFELVGPSDNPYPGTVCIPSIEVPAGFSVSAGDRATIQVVEAAVHGAALYSCVDITFVDPGDALSVNETNCFNSTTIKFSSDGASSSQLDLTSSTPVETTAAATTTTDATGAAIPTNAATIHKSDPGIWIWALVFLLMFSV